MSNDDRRQSLMSRLQKLLHGGQVDDKPTADFEGQRKLLQKAVDRVNQEFFKDDPKGYQIFLHSVKFGTDLMWFLPYISDHPMKVRSQKMEKCIIGKTSIALTNGRAKKDNIQLKTEQQFYDGIISTLELYISEQETGKPEDMISAYRKF